MGLAELQVHVSPMLIKKSRPGAFAPREPLDDRPEPPDRTDECTLLAVAEMSWAMLLVTPLVIGQWRGCWELMVYYTPESVSICLFV